jgi:hypothetical protein
MMGVVDEVVGSEATGGVLNPLRFPRGTAPR